MRALNAWPIAVGLLVSLLSGCTNIGANAERSSFAAGEPAIAQIAGPCSRELESACTSFNSSQTLICSQQRWRAEVLCDADARCDTRQGDTQGTCQPVLPICAEHEPGQAVCDAELQRTCGPDLVDTQVQACGLNERCVEAIAGLTCACIPGTKQDGAGICRPFGEPGAIAVGAACSEPERKACLGHNSRQALICRDGGWQENATCAESQRCDTRAGDQQGTCQDVVALCQGKQPGQKVCDGNLVRACYADLVGATPGIACIFRAHCSDDGSGARCVCDDGYGGVERGFCLEESPLGEAAIATVGTYCDSSLKGVKACEGHRSGHALKCIDNVWRESSCSGVCDTQLGPAQGTCRSMLPECVNRGPDEIVRVEGTRRIFCNVDGLALVDGDPCPANSHGYGGRTCDCDPGFESDAAAGCRNIDDCAGSPCLHGGTCTDLTLGYVCDCSATGNAGWDCELDASDCSSQSLCPPEYPCLDAEGGSYCQGQHAEWPIVQTPSYASSTDDTLVDTTTGLMWQRRLPTSYAGCSTGIESAPCLRTEAVAYCEQLVLDGFDDWRLPSKVELESLTVDAPQDPSIDDFAFPGTPSSALFLSVSVNLAQAGDWTVNFRNTQSKSLPMATGLARCVRTERVAGPFASLDRYTLVSEDPTGATVRDTRTGLVWLRLRKDGEYTYDAKLSCEALTQAGGGFHLATRKELLSLIDPLRVGGALDPRVFTRRVSDWYASSSGAWAVTEAGETIEDQEQEGIWFLCVR